MLQQVYADAIDGVAISCKVTVVETDELSPREVVERILKASNVLRTSLQRMQQPEP